MCKSNVIKNAMELISAVEEKFVKHAYYRENWRGVYVVKIANETATVKAIAKRNHNPYNSCDCDVTIYVDDVETYSRKYSFKEGQEVYEGDVKAINEIIQSADNVSMYTA